MNSAFFKRIYNRNQERKTEGNGEGDETGDDEGEEADTNQSSNIDLTHIDVDTNHGGGGGGGGDETIYDSGINIDLKTTISTEKPVFDVNDKFLPHGNYYFTIRKFTERNTGVGNIEIANERHTYEFKNYTIIRLMAKSQSRLCRRAGIEHIDMPRYGSPSNSPSILRNVVLDSPRRSPRICSRMSPKIEQNKRALNIQTRSISESSDELMSCCSICIDDIALTDVARLPCGHYFHKKCIRAWEKTQKRAKKDFDCPNCKAVIIR